MDATPQGWDWATVVGTTKVFIDTSSLMRPTCEEALRRHLIPALAQSRQTIIVPHRVVEELQKHEASTDATRQRSAKRGLRTLQALQHEGLAEVFGDQNDGFADSVFLHVIARICLRHDVVLITNDSTLSKEVSDLAHRQSVRTSRSILTFRVGQDGALKPGHGRWKGKTRRPIRRPSSNDSHDKVANRATTGFRFHRPSVPCSGDQTLLKVSRLPTDGDVVSAGNTRLSLAGRIAAGGEGTVYSTDTPSSVCKVYHADRLTVGRRQKLELMTRASLRVPGVCWPDRLISFEATDFVGYTMPRATGMPLAKSVFLPPVLRSQFSRWTRKQLVEIAKQIAGAVSTLHSHGVIIGDLNPQNILVTESGMVTMVDADSFQIAGHACPVGMVNFMPPELHSIDLAKNLRSEQHDLFALATLIFMTLMPGKPPYSQQGGADPSENIRKAEFPYTAGEKRARNLPLGPWRMIWSHFPHRTKKAFAAVFSEGQRLTAREWTSVLQAYANDLEKGWVSDEVFPSSFKGVSRHAADIYGSHEDSLPEYTCKQCGAHFRDAAGLEQAHKPVRGPYCRRCFQTTGAETACQDCGTRFLTTHSERLRFVTKSLQPPKRCLVCRAARKREQESGGPPRSPATQTRRPGHATRTATPGRRASATAGHHPKRGGRQSSQRSQTTRGAGQTGSSRHTNTEPEFVLVSLAKFLWKLFS